MSLRTRSKTFSSIIGLSCCALIPLLCFASSVYAEGKPNHVLLRDNVTQSQRLQLARALNKIAGSPQLRFDENGSLLLGSKDPKAGSSMARELLEKAVTGARVIILEDASTESHERSPGEIHPPREASFGRLRHRRGVGVTAQSVEADLQFKA